MNHCACEGEGTIPVEGNHFCAVIFFPSFLLSLFWKKFNYALTNKVARPLLTLPPNRMGLVVDCAQNARLFGAFWVQSTTSPIRLEGGVSKALPGTGSHTASKAILKLKIPARQLRRNVRSPGLRYGTVLDTGAIYVRHHRLTDGRFASISYQG